MSEETKVVKTEEEVTETKQVEETKPAPVEAKSEEQPKEEPKKGIFKRVTESKAAKIGGALLLLFGAAKVGEKLGEKKAQREFESNVIDVEDEPTDSYSEEDTE